jgi:hypothetical protein
MSDLGKQVNNERRSGIERRNSLEDEIKDLRNIIFNMLNFTNMYALVLDQNLVVRFANSSLSIDLGFKGYTDLIGRCWLDFVSDKERDIISVIHKSISNGISGWEKYREFKNVIVNSNGDTIEVHWFNSHINTDLNWTFSFGIRKRPVVIDDINMDSIRSYYRDIINKDREMIIAMRDVIHLRDKIVDTCKPGFTTDDKIYV